MSDIDISTMATAIARNFFVGFMFIKGSISLGWDGHAPASRNAFGVQYRWPFPPQATA